MSWREVDGTIQALGTLEQITTSLSKGALVGASVSIIEPYTDFEPVYVILTINETNTSHRKTRPNLASGFLFYQRPITWIGTIPINDQDLVVLKAIGPAGVELRLATYTLDPSFIKAGFPIDP